MGLLRFIRNLHVHQFDADFDPDVRLFLRVPFFLDKFPSLVTRCWVALSKVRRSHTDITRSLLHPFLVTPAIATLEFEEVNSNWV
jgi:hypothetical protein